MEVSCASLVAPESCTKRRRCCGHTHSKAVPNFAPELVWLRRRIPLVLVFVRDTLLEGFYRRLRADCPPLVPSVDVPLLGLSHHRRTNLVTTRE
jgi:hypothetical protein